MESSDLISMEGGYKKKLRSCREKMITFCYKLMNPFIVAGERRIKRPKFQAKDFKLPSDLQVAKYDPEIVADYWNHQNLPRTFCEAVAQFFYRGIWAKSAPILFLYLLQYYVLNKFIFNLALCTDQVNATTSSSGNHSALLCPTGYVQLALSNEMCCNEAKFKSWKNMEKDFTKILTFFIGFIVSLSVKTWFDQVKLIPKLDAMLIQINNFIWVDPSKKSNRIIGSMSATEFRKTIFRYFLLSWTMCLSRMGLKLHDAFDKPSKLNQKQLLLKREFDELKVETDGENWREKWSSPLSWIAKMVNDPKLKDMKFKNQDPIEILDVKDGIGKSLNAYCQDLQKLSSFNEYRIPTPLISLLTVAIYVFLIISVAAGQDMYPDKGIQKTFVQIIFDLPEFSVVKYLLIFGWLRVAADLMVPFGEGR